MRKVHRMQFMKELTEYWDKAGSPLCRIPVIGGTELNLHLLHTTVAKLGGYECVCAERRWMEVAPPPPSPSPPPPPCPSPSPHALAWVCPLAR